MILRIVDLMNVLPHFDQRKTYLATLEVIIRNVTNAFQTLFNLMYTDSKNKRWFLSTYSIRHMRAEVVSKKNMRF